MSLLIIGARPGSLGAALAEAAVDWGNGQVCTAGLGEEQYKMDVRRPEQIKAVLQDTMPIRVVCTVGVNDSGTPFMDDFTPSLMASAFQSNVIGPMNVLRIWAKMSYASYQRRKFVAISSNSARIARTQSMAYCASKAALSMSLRVAARELARGNAGVQVWGYEPGLLNTSMSREMFPDLPNPGNSIGPFHRMEGEPVEGLSPHQLANRIMFDLNESTGLNGCMIPFDSGEQ